jgi:[ribosomal protein S5]-alanine N-acetyltransferase
MPPVAREPTIRPYSAARVTDRLTLQPIGARHAEDLCTLHRDGLVALWHGGEWSMDDAHRFATATHQAWRTHGVGQWIAYHRQTGALIGRGGLSLAPVDGKVRLEIGWTLRDRFQGRGYASEIGRAGLAFAFDDLDAPEVVSLTERHNARSRAVMKRLGMYFTRDVTHDDQPLVLYTLRRSEYAPVAPRRALSRRE